MEPEGIPVTVEEVEFALSNDGYVFHTELARLYLETLMAEIRRLRTALGEAVQYEVMHKLRTGEYKTLYYCKSCKEPFGILYTGLCEECRDEKLRRQGTAGW